MEPCLSYTNVGQVFAGTTVLDGVSFDVPAGAFVAVLGPSGCGKSTLVQMAAGLLRPSSGGVLYHGRPIPGPNAGIGLVPQQAQLMPWKTLIENVALPLELRGVAAGERRQRAEAAIAAVDLSGFEGHYPYQLSGGMQKRASIARTLVYRPDTILMDEPFGALDAQTRMVMQRDLQTLVAGNGASVLLVTHDVAEAVLLADTVVVLSRRPTTVLATVPIDLPRPRDVFQPHTIEGFGAAYDSVWRYVRRELVAG